MASRNTPADAARQLLDDVAASERSDDPQVQAIMAVAWAVLEVADVGWLLAATLRTARDSDDDSSDKEAG